MVSKMKKLYCFPIVLPRLDKDHVLMYILDLFFVKTIQELMQMVKKLREDVEAQVNKMK